MKTKIVKLMMSALLLTALVNSAAAQCGRHGFRHVRPYVALVMPPPLPPPPAYMGTYHPYRPQKVWVEGYWQNTRRGPFWVPGRWRRI